MTDLQEYIKKRTARSDEFAETFDEGYEAFKIGVLLKNLREQSGFTQEEVARRMGTRKTAISRIENHAADMRLSTLERYVDALGKKLTVRISG